MLKLNLNKLHLIRFELYRTEGLPDLFSDNIYFGHFFDRFSGNGQRQFYFGSLSLQFAEMKKYGAISLKSRAAVDQHRVSRTRNFQGFQQWRFQIICPCWKRPCRKWISDSPSILCCKSVGCICRGGNLVAPAKSK